ncbi:hypothetical protein BDY19DRAFT_1057848 [Irpex rosettiformis]|uniref:Uncharacterized protein n=1 Tax=Irpex rosettiformis TaxID=378272 RepID=A0ACB8U0H9_9APHY|nr:hypothetical protein BDY19DRAFT_1057848 [Irpex rosettiformis]
MSPDAIFSDEHLVDSFKPSKKQQNNGYGFRKLVAATIMDLPVELLIQIFVHCSHLVGGYDLPQIAVSEVCGFWRDVVLDTPRAWQYISLDDRHRPLRASHKLARVWLERSQNFPVDIRINVSDSENLLALISPLVIHVRRWRRFTIEGQVQEDVDFRSLYEGSYPELDALTVFIKGPETPTQGTQPPLRVFHCAPPIDHSHSSIRSYRVFLHHEALRLPVPQQISAMHLRTLIIRENNSLDVIPDPIRLINFLQCCPELWVFHYLALPHEPTPPTNRIPLPIVKLPNLRCLVLRSTCAVRAILSHIDAPELRELYLEHTNMEFLLQHAAAFTTEPEEGDSDDEACDFSQSPWSDHATGMGLRSLLRRSNPPLEILEMDYADMRTKDFLWCFDHLNTLRDFRIVASDMSDKVIQMLAPYRPMCIYSFSSDRDELLNFAPYAWGLEPPRVRLPRLSALELWNCQRLTGNAVVAALGARVQYTDQIANRNAYSRLSDVAIVGCADFLPHHAEGLLSVLGKRLRVHA